MELGHHPEDTEDEKLRKSSLFIMSAPFAVAALIWGLLYFLNGLTVPGLIPFSYGILSVLSIIHFSKTTKYKVFRSSQLLLILILPFALQLSLGGFIPGSAVIMWALVSPAGALVFYSKKQALNWFLAYVMLVIIAFIINDKLPEYFNWNIEQSFINALFLLNIIGISSIIFMIQYYFVGKQTELKAAIEQNVVELNHQSKKLKELDEMKSRFFANISHEFRTPLTLILGLLNKQISNSEDPPNVQDNDTMKRNAQRLLQLINQLLDLSKLESGEVQLEVSKFDISYFTKKTIILFESLAYDKNISLMFNGHTIAEDHRNEKIEIYFDQEKLQKVLTNLVSNAIKFTPVDGVIEFDLETNAEGVKISISNSGEGIPEDNLPHVFDRFYQVNTSDTRQYEGTGIGLSLVKELVELHHGSVSVESSSERTIFTVTLPINEDLFTKYGKVKLPPDEAIRKEIIYETGIVVNSSKSIKLEPEVGLEEKDSDQLEILIVEDNLDLRMFIKDILDKNYKVIQAADGLEGLEKAETSIPDLIVSDVMMPKMDGYELCKQLKTNKKTNHIPVILITAKASQENKLEGLEIGADDYLIKPFDEKELIIRIKNLISIREQLQMKYQQEVWLKPKEVKISSVHQKFLESIKEVIEKNIDNHQFGVEDLGDEIAMSRTQLYRKLKALTDQPATTFIRNYRLHRAAELLKKEANNVTEIAYQVGFSSQTYFSTCFLELFGCAPSEYASRES